MKQLLKGLKKELEDLEDDLELMPDGLFLSQRRKVMTVVPNLHKEKGKKQKNKSEEEEEEEEDAEEGEVEEDKKEEQIQRFKSNKAELGF